MQLLKSFKISNIKLTLYIKYILLNDIKNIEKEFTSTIVSKVLLIAISCLIRLQRY